MDKVGLYEFDRRKELGRGGFGTVYEGNEKRNKSRKVAVKVMKTNSSTTLQRELDMLKEISELNHENFVKLLDSKEKRDEAILVMEFCRQDMTAYIRQLKSLPEKTVAIFTRQIVRGLKVLHSHNIIHRDLKPQNLLLSYKEANPVPENIVVKIADFGLARFLPPGNNQELTQCGTVIYTAPEAMLGAKYDSKADIWSVGLIIHEMFFGCPPFAATIPFLFILPEIFFKARQNYSCPNGPPPPLKDLLNRAIKFNPADRADLHTLAAHPFLQGLTERENLLEIKQKYLPVNMSRDFKRTLYNHAYQLKDVPPWEDLNSVKLKTTDQAEIDFYLNDKVSIWGGDITKLEVDAIVNTSKPDLSKGRTGADLAIHTAAGPLLEKEAQVLIGRCDPGSAEVTAGYNLPAYYVIHTVGPQHNEHDVLSSCYESCLQKVIDYKLRSVAFPTIATGNLGFRLKDATEIALRTVRNWLKTGKNTSRVERIVFVCFTEDAYEIYNKCMPRYFPKA